MGVSFDLLTVTGALEQLTDRDIVQGIDSLGGPRYYAFTAHLYWEWVSKYKALSRVVPELAKEAVGALPHGEGHNLNFIERSPK